MKQYLDGPFPVPPPSAPSDMEVRPSHGDTVFGMCLVLSVAFCVFELAVHLLHAETYFQVLALILAVALWAALAATIEFLDLSLSRRFQLLCVTALVSNLLLLFSQSTTTWIGLTMYAMDCFAKCVLVMLMLLRNEESGPYLDTAELPTNRAFRA